MNPTTTGSLVSAPTLLKRKVSYLGDVLEAGLENKYYPSPKILQFFRLLEAQI